MTKVKKMKDIQVPSPIDKKNVSLDSLFLDNKNPRFGGVLENNSQPEIIEKLAKEKNLLELIESFSKNGYYEAEPLLVVEDIKEKGKYVVIEGNRRVAALKVLFSVDLLKKFGFANKDLTPKGNLATRLKEEIPVQVYNSRDDLWSYLGFRHIKGAMAWDPYSKALYIASLFDNGTSIEEIVERIGDQNSLVAKMSNGSRVIQQAEKEGYIKPQAISKFAFSHFYTILGYKEARSFLGLKGADSVVLKKDPIPRNKLENLKTLVEFIYGSTDGKVKSVIKSQNPDIRRLAGILADSETLAELKDNTDQPGILENVYNTTKAAANEAKELVPTLIAEALSKLKKAMGNLYAYKKADATVRKQVGELKKIAEYLIDEFEESDDKKNKKKGKK